jgi:iron-sulfur cluster repair protein YtfE (RIC family)
MTQISTKRYGLPFGGLLFATPARMDALQLLADDHKRISGLFDLLQRTQKMDEKRTLFREIKEELELHLFMEEKILFPALASFDKMARHLDKAYDEVDEISDILEEIDEMEFDPATELKTFADATEELRTVFSEHDENTVHDFFPVIHKFLDVNTLNTLGSEIKAIRSLGMAA